MGFDRRGAGSLSLSGFIGKTPTPTIISGSMPTRGCKTGLPFYSGLIGCSKCSTPHRCTVLFCPARRSRKTRFVLSRDEHDPAGRSEGDRGSVPAAWPNIRDHGRRTGNWDDGRAPVLSKGQRLAGGDVTQNWQPSALARWPIHAVHSKCKMFV